MNEREIAEIRRRFKPERSNISHVCGCYINEKKEIIATFDQPLGETTPVMSEQVIGILRATLSGRPDRNLHPIPFSTRAVTDGEEHRLLSALRKSELRDTEAVSAFYDRVRTALDMEGNYLILLAHDRYDVPTHSKNGEENGSDTVFSYILCSICPVKTDLRPTLGIEAKEHRLRSLTGDPCVAKPEMGFLFPAFDDRAANLYSAWFYTRSVSEGHGDFTQAVFGAEPPMPAAAQKETFHRVLATAAGEDCSYDMVEELRAGVGRLMEAHKASGDREPLYLSSAAAADLLSECGLPAGKKEAFRTEYEAAFGAGAELRPANLVDVKKLTVTTPDVSIRVAPERGELVQTREIDGVKYILIRAEGEVEVNGVRIAFDHA